MDKQQIKIAINPIISYVTGVNIAHGEEEFVTLLTCGSQAFQFAFSPKHMKRLSLLLDQQIKEYEGKFGELKTELSKVQKETTMENRKMGFQ